MDSVPDPYENAYMSVGMLYKQPGLIFDNRMIDHYCLWDSSYPEKPERFTSVYERIESMGLVSAMMLLEPRKATAEEIEMCHTSDHRRKLEATGSNVDAKELEKVSSEYDAIYINNNTYELALLSAGSTIEMVDRICSERIPSGFALVRPPGHHAMTTEYCGYCFFNNVALAAKHAIKEYDFERILIVDWDVHHGQATQQMFYDDNRVLYFSIHRYEHGSFWPNLRESDYDSIGEGNGKGYNFNIPLNKTGMTNADYLAIFNNVLLPVASEYQPELVIVSAGYDAAVGCPEGEMKITPACYAHLLWSLKNLAKGKMAVVLEGGYCLDSLAEGAALTARALIGHPCPMLADRLEEPSSEVVTTILDVIHVQEDYWNCFIQCDKLVKQSRLEINPFERVHVPSQLTFLHDGIKPESYATRDCYPVQSQVFLDEIGVELNRLRLSTNLTFPPNQLTFVYDATMMKHDPHPKSARVHPEDPTRISATYTVFLEHKLPSRSRQLPARLATYDELSTVHYADFINKMLATSLCNDMKHREAEDLYNSVGFGQFTFECARFAAGSLVEIVDEVLSGRSQSGVAIIRPPGHHASASTAQGFCYFNNIAIAAKHARTKYSLDRILILDWDVHHGNGTQQLFYEDEHVLYISLHVFKNATFFPNTQSSDLMYTGQKRGLGYNVNIPWSNHGVGDSEYLTAFHTIILPIAYQYNPELVLISAGFDAAIADPIGRCNVTPEAFGHFTHYMSALANGRVILALEGGYNKESVALSMTICAKALLNDPLPQLSPDYENMKEVNTMRRVISTQREHWKCLRFDTRITKDSEVDEQVIGNTSSEQSEDLDESVENDNNVEP